MNPLNPLKPSGDSLSPDVSESKEINSEENSKVKEVIQPVFQTMKTDLPTSGEKNPLLNVSAVLKENPVVTTDEFVITKYYVTADDLLEKVDPMFRSDPCVLELIQMFYEVLPFAMQNTSGYTFPFFPEIIYLMQETIEKSSSKTPFFVELGAGTGLKPLLFAFTNPKAKIYINDISKRDMKAALDYVKTNFPKNGGIKKKNIVFNVGNCLEFLKNFSELEGEVELCSAFHVIHFLGTEDRIKFLSMIKRMLKPGGRIVISSHALEAMSKLDPSLEATMKDNPNLCEFKHVSLAAFEGKTKIRIIQKIYPRDTEAPSLTTQDIKSFKDLTIAEINQKTNEFEFANIDVKKIAEFFPKESDLAEVMEELEKLKRDSKKYIEIFIESADTVAFSEAGVTEVLNEAGFSNVHVYSIGSNGHITEGNNFRSLCAIAIKPPEEEEKKIGVTP